MKVFYKYPVGSMYSTNTISLLKGSIISSVISQNNTIQLYALVDLTQTEKETWTIDVVPTGTVFNMHTNCKFLGTIQHLNGLVFHVYYKKD